MTCSYLPQACDEASVQTVRVAGGSLIRVGLSTGGGPTMAEERSEGVLEPSLETCLSCERRSSVASAENGSEGEIQLSLGRQRY